MKSITVIEDCCEEIEINNNTSDCCEPDSGPVKDFSCDVMSENGNCCETNIDYYRLSEWFIQSHDENSLPDHILPELRLIENNRVDIADEIVNLQPANFVGPQPKIPIFRLFHQEKIAPPAV